MTVIRKKRLQELLKTNRLITIEARLFNMMAVHNRDLLLIEIELKKLAARVKELENFYA